MNRNLVDLAIEIDADLGAPATPPAVSSSLGYRILTLLFLVRSSGQQVYKQEFALKEIELRLVGVLGRNGPMTSIQLANAMGIDKPQVSRASTALSAKGLIERGLDRARFELTADGRNVFERMRTISEARHERIMSGLDGADLEFLSAMIATLMRLGEDWLAEEQNVSDAAAASDEARILSAAGDVPPAGSLIPSLVRMSMLMHRSLYLVWKRTVGISPFNWFVLSRVAEAGRLRFSALVYQTGRDKGQVWRTVERMIEEDLLVRHKDPVSRVVELTVTRKGADIYKITAELSLRRVELITAALGRKNKNLFVDLVEIMIRNTQQLMVRETGF